MIISPNFWYKKNFFSKLTGYFFFPVSLLWIAVSIIKKIVIKPYTTKLKVFCIGNLTVGGTGKTPFTIYVYKLLKSLGYNPVFLTRGYGGTSKLPIVVEPFHEPYLVGDEAILLSKIGTTVVSKNRAKGAQFIEKFIKKFDVILMDDGLQNYQLRQDLKILLVDKKNTFGNNLCLPAGPLREPVKSGLKKIDLIVLTGDRQNKSQVMFEKYKHIPIFESKLKLHKNNNDKNYNYLAFCALANPKKFFNTLVENKYKVSKRIMFPDHHAYTNKDIDNIINQARTHNLKIITTEKDFVKIKKNKSGIDYLSIEMNLSIKDKYIFKKLIESKLNE